MLAKQEGANIGEIGRRFKVSRKTIYKWMKRFNEQGDEGLRDRSRRPNRSPRRARKKIETEVLRIRDEHPVWGARKIGGRLNMLGQKGVPSDSTIHQILRRHDRIAAEQSVKHTAWKRFEHAAPNDLWQMDFKGWFTVGRGVKCHPLTILDDHSRYVVCLKACTDQRTQTVQTEMTERFRRFGLPLRMTMDNGAPWGNDVEHPYTPLTVWLIRLGIRVSHSRPYHPQTQGKDERFHRTLKAELLGGRQFASIPEIQRSFDQWLHVYNCERPHQAIGMAAPASRYQISWREFPEVLPQIEYSSSDEVRRVNEKGQVRYAGRHIVLGKAFHGYSVGIRRTLDDGIVDVYFSHHRIQQINLRELQ
jgi:transposase InsO family protein